MLTDALKAFVNESVLEIDFFDSFLYFLQK